MNTHLSDQMLYNIRLRNKAIRTGETVFFIDVADSASTSCIHPLCATTDLTSGRFLRISIISGKKDDEFSDALPMLFLSRKEAETFLQKLSRIRSWGLRICSCQLRWRRYPNGRRMLAMRKSGWRACRRNDIPTE